MVERGRGENRGLEGVSQKAVQLWRGKKCAPAGHYLIHQRFRFPLEVCGISTLNVF